MRKFARIVIALALTAMVPACQTNIYYPNELDRFESLTSPSTVLLIYGVAFNNLNSYIQGNLNTVARNKLPAPGSDQVILSFTNFSDGALSWKKENPSHLIRYSTFDGKVRRDTVLTIEAGRKAVDPDVMKEVLDYVRSHYKAERYGLILSSHGSGWLPAGYVYTEEQDRWMHYHELGSGVANKIPWNSVKRFPAFSGPLTKTFGAEYHGEYNVSAEVYEMSVPSLAKAIGTGWDFIVLDACFMGCVEVAWELRNCADELCISAAEVLADGFNYRTMADIVFRRGEVAENICRSYFDYYSHYGSYRSATIANVRTAGLENLKNVCKTLVGKYKTELSEADTSAIQVFSQNGRKWFYDLRDVFVKSGISPEDDALLCDALDKCISYKAATARIMDNIDIRTFCGLSMFLPTKADTVLINAYRENSWNKEVNLVEE